MVFRAVVQSTSDCCAEEKHLRSSDDDDFAAVHGVFHTLRVEKHEKVAHDQRSYDTHDQISLPAPVSEKMVGQHDETAEHDSHNARQVKGQKLLGCFATHCVVQMVGDACPHVKRTAKGSESHQDPTLPGLQG